MPASAPVRAAIQPNERRLGREPCQANLTPRIKNTLFNEEKDIGSINPTEGGELRARPVFKTIRHNGVMETEAGTRAESVSTPRKRRHGFEARKMDFSSYFFA